MNDSFNLVSESWIPVLYKDGKTKLVSIREFFDSCGDIYRLSCENAAVDTAVMSFLLAIFYRAVVLDGANTCPWFFAGADVVSVLKNINVNRDDILRTIHAYLDRFYSRFDLLSNEPFMQIADLGIPDSVSGVGQLRKILGGSDNKKSLASDMDVSVSDTLTYDEAARLLIATQALDVSGIHSLATNETRTGGGIKNGKFYSTGQSVGWLGSLGGCLLRCDNMWDTLVSNFVFADVDERSDFCNVVRDFSEDIPVWEREPLGTDYTQVVCLGTTDLLVFQSRRIRLVADGGRIVKAFVTYQDPVNLESDIKQYEIRSAFRLNGKTHIWMPCGYYDASHDVMRRMFEDFGTLDSDWSERIPTQVIRWRQKCQEVLCESGVSLSDLWSYIPEKVFVTMSGVLYGPQSGSVSRVLNDELLVSGRFWVDDIDFMDNAVALYNLILSISSISFGYILGRKLYVLQNGGTTDFKSDVCKTFASVIEQEGYMQLLLVYREAVVRDDFVDVMDNIVDNIKQTAYEYIDSVLSTTSSLDVIGVPVSNSVDGNGWLTVDAIARAAKSSVSKKCA